MTKQNRIEQCNKMLHAGMANLFQSQSVLSITEFVITILEILMLLEREEYLKSAENQKDIGNGTYQRSFHALQSNNLLLRIPRTCYYP